MTTFSILSFITATLSVALATYFIVIKMKKSDSATEEYFTGGRALGWPVVAGSLLLTNLSTEQLVGLNGDVFGDKLFANVAGPSDDESTLFSILSIPGDIITNKGGWRDSSF